MKSDLVQDLLDDIDYSDDINYVPEKFSLIMLNFIKSVGGDNQEEHKSPVMHNRMLDSYDDNDKDMVINLCHRGSAKALALDTVLHGKYTSTTIGSVKVGEKIYGEDGYLAEVTAKSEVFYKPTYEMILEDGRSLISSLDHLNSVIINGSRKEISTGMLSAQSNLTEYRIPCNEPIEFPEEDLQFDSYYHGIFIAKLGNVQKLADNDYSLFIRGSVSQRLAFLHGLMDTQGSINLDGSMFFIAGVNERLAHSLANLVRSLSGVASYQLVKKKWVVDIKINRKIFTSHSKYLLQKFDHRMDSVKIKSLELIDMVPTQCISVNSESKTFLANDYLVTHNTTLNEYTILFTAVTGGLPNFGRFKYGLYVSDTILNGVKKMRLRLEMQLTNSEYLRKYIVDYKITDTRWYFKNAAGQEIVWTGHSAEAGMRGVVELRERPSVALYDDLLSDKNASSPRIVKSILHTIYAAVAFALHPSRSKQIWSGTPFNAADPIYSGILSGVWFANVFPVCEKFPVPEKDFIGSWACRFDYKYVQKKYDIAASTGTLAMFYKELMLSIAHANYALVKEDDIGIVSRSPIIHNKNNFTFYIVTDFATTEEDSGDYSVAIVIAVSSIGSIFIIDGFCKKQSMQSNITDLFTLAKKWKPYEVGIEASGQQGGFISIIENKMLNENVYFDIARRRDVEGNYGKKGFAPCTHKLDRYLIFHPTVEIGRLFIVEELRDTALWEEMFEELTLITPDGIKSLNDDVIDALSSISELEFMLPATAIPDPDLLDREDVAAGQGPLIDIWNNGGIIKDITEDDSNYINPFELDDDEGVGNYLGN